MPIMLDSYSISKAGLVPQISDEQKDVSQYGAVLAFEPDDAMDMTIRQLCTLFGKNNRDESVLMTAHSFNYEGKTLTGVWIRNDIPFWIGGIIRDYMNGFMRIAANPDTQILVDTSETFDHWFGDFPTPLDFTHDLVLISTTHAMFSAHLEEFAKSQHGWHVPKESPFPLFLTVSQINKERITLQPYGDLIRLFPFKLAHTIEEFKQMCIVHSCCLFASSTSAASSLAISDTHNFQ